MTATVAGLGGGRALGAGGTGHLHSHGPDGLWLDKPGKGTTAAAPYDVDAHAPWASSEYDGQALAQDASDLTTLPTFHLIYFYPKDRASRFGQFAAMFQADARQASSRLAELFGRGVRFDERAGDCPGGSCMDITVVKSSSNHKRLGSGSQFSIVAKELLDRGFNAPNKKYAVWLDAPSRYCGQANLYQDTQRTPANPNEGRTTAIVYRPYADTSNPTTGGFCRGRVLLHELGHNMGALQRVAPHAFDGAHCNDSAEDVMCYTSQTSFDSGGPEFDYGNDDYWDAAADPTPAAGAGSKLPWWSANLSKFVCPTSGCGLANDPIY